MGKWNGGPRENYQNDKHLLIKADGVIIYYRTFFEEEQSS